VAGLPAGIAQIYSKTFVTNQWHPLQMIVILAVMVLVVAFIVLVERGERRIPVQYAKRVWAAGCWVGSPRTCLSR